MEFKNAWMLYGINAQLRALWLAIVLGGGGGGGVLLGNELS